MMMSDIKDILEIERHQGQEINKESTVGPERKCRKILRSVKSLKKPEGMAREVYALLYNDKQNIPSLFPSDTGRCYKNNKANLGMKKVRAWKWMPFKNPARTDNAIFHHWQRECDEDKQYPFAQFNKKVQIPSYSDSEYACYLANDSWSRAETDHLFDLCNRFDLRFGVMADRWDLTKFNKRSIEDLKERYYEICSILAKIKTAEGLTAEMKNYVFDADHERKRKKQLAKLYNRTIEQVEEEQMLLSELRKIETRKKERDKKTLDLHKLINAADCQMVEIKRSGRIPKNKLAPSSRTRVGSVSSEMCIKFPDLKGSGVYLRSLRMKLPANIGQKKIKAIEQLLFEMNIDCNQMPTEEICQQFNELRCDLLLLHELRTALATCHFELQSLRHQYEANHPGKTLVIPSTLLANVSGPDVMMKEQFETGKIEIAQFSESFNDMTLL
ncbi:DNA methyltransferase 1-associated protein 1-like isoform X2 [Rhodnius prolixus]